MHSRVKGKGVLVQPENNIQIRGPWVPSTPGNPTMPRSNGIPIQRNGNQIGRRDWSEFLEIMNKRSQQVSNFDPTGLMNQSSSSYNLGGHATENRSLSNNVGSHTQTQTFHNDIPCWTNTHLGGFSVGNNSVVPMASTTRTLTWNAIQKSTIPASGTPPMFIPEMDPLRTPACLNLNMRPENIPTVMSSNMRSTTAPAILDSYSEIDSSWMEGNFTRLLLGGENPSLGSNNHWTNVDSSPPMPRGGFPFPLLPQYNLNSPPRCEADAASSNTNSFLFAPVTPDHRKLFEKQSHAEMLNFLVDEGSCQGQDKMEYLFSCIANEAIESHSNELLQTIVDSSSAAISTPLTENKCVEERGDQEIDLNETPKQKTPKRRKHRPRVVIEGKPKRTPKPKTPKNTNSEEKKRKYVRKKKNPEVENTEAPQTDVINSVKVPSFESQEKSCRKRLHFDIEKTEGEIQDKAATFQVEIHRENGAMLNIDLNSQAGSTRNFNDSNQLPVESLPGAKWNATNAPSGTINNTTLNIIARNVSMRNGSLYPKSGMNSNSREHLHLQGELNNNVSRANSDIHLEKTREMRWKSTHQMVERDVGNFKGFCGSKREYTHSMEQAGLSATHKIGSPYMCREKCQLGNQETLSPNVGTLSTETQKKQKIENGFQTILCSTQKENWNMCANSTSQSSSQILVSYSQGDGISDRQENGSNGTGRESSSHSMNAEHNMQRKLAASNQQSVTEMMAWKTPSRSTQVHNSASLAVMTKSNLQSSNTSEQAAASGFEQGTEKYHSNKQRNRPNVAPSSFSAVSFCTNKATLQERKDASLVYQQSPMKAREAKQYSKKIIEEITYRLRSLNISNEGEATHGIDKYALVPYKEGGAMVPYETKKRKPRPKVDLDPETNRIWKLLMGKEGCEASEEENKDKEKWWEEERRVFHGRANSFIARMHLVQGDRRFSQWKGSVVDSVIGVFLTQNVSDHLSSSAFMALAAQFPLWSTTPDQTSDQSGTSILTEEPGIRGLAPVGTMKCTEKIMRQPFYNQTSETYLESPGTGRVILPTDTNGVSDENGSSSQNSSDSFALHINGEIQSSSGSNSEAEDSGQVGKSIKNNGLSTVQHTNRTTTFQVLESSENESLCFDNMFTHFYKQSEEVDYSKQIPGSDMFNNLEGFSTLTHPVNSSISNMQKPTMPPSYFQLHMAPHIARQEVDCFEISREECISSFPSSTSGRTNGKGADYTSNTVGHTAEKTSGTLFQQNGLPESQMGNTGLFAFLTKHLTDPKSKLEPVPQIGKDQLSLNNHQLERSWIFESENTVFEKPGGPIEPVILRKSGSRDQVSNVAKHTGLGIEERTTAANKQIFLEEKITDGHAKGQEYVSSETITGIGTNTLNTRSGKQEKEKRESFDWDSLRKQVQPNGRRKERSKDTSDSMDYETMRCADVNEISNSIKIRGMNNMLAERIKDFLNRLVREHESIDLEWLKDVPPDKAKDYLLSIRGLGLKSVECVRLLTLHHLAFPVDTNVGRIAVRLGWVPLQPLPESLQLHLLELYPVLESVQKYLWPRLCKLDQRTLYELHYQLITFGKVFCTKSKPNCNACPMRGECRHFASAFASARLALPGPEEKSIVSSTMPIATDRKAAVSIKPMLLQPSGSNGERELMVSSCEPIIEEPATPEPEIAEITETDIEDAFYEDPDEIPTIKLNVEQLTVNLRNFMEEHTDLQESDMSKALVALTPEAASIPAPKLKYVVRLRTERQVYILPDTHPLLNGLDKREKDDPSPYLLALLAPGEASSSAQPPERWYKSSETGELCKEKACSSFNSVAEANSQIVRGTLLIPCRTAMKGSFPLNGTYFQVNEVFADHESSIHPIDVPRAWLWHLEKRTVYFGTSATTIFRGMTTKEIQNSFWRGFVCVRGFDREKRAPRPLNRNLHIPASKPVKTNNAAEQKDQSDKPINF